MKRFILTLSVINAYRIDRVGPYKFAFFLSPVQMFAHEAGRER